MRYALGRVLLAPKADLLLGLGLLHQDGGLIRGLGTSLGHSLDQLADNIPLARLLDLDGQLLLGQMGSGDRVGRQRGLGFRR